MPMWTVVAVLVVTTFAISGVTDRYVLTPDVLRNLVGVDAGSSADDALQRFTVWRYAAIPVQVVVRIGFAALIVQMVCLVGMVELRYGQAFRAAAIAFPATLWASIVQLIWLVRRDPGSLDPTLLTRAPDSLAMLVTPNQVVSWAHAMMSHASLSQLLWVGLLYAALRGTRGVGGRSAWVAAAGTWIVLALLKTGATLIGQQIGMG